MVLGLDEVVRLHVTSTAAAKSASSDPVEGVTADC
jgi:hypothetical protein